MKRLLVMLEVFVFGFLCMGFIGFASVSLAETYYVRRGGDNNNVGTGLSKNEAWKTISYAVSQLRAGDICYVMDDDGGTYPEIIEVTNTVCKNGTKTEPITLATYPGDTVTVTCSGSWKYTICLVSVRHWVIDGFNVSAIGSNHYMIDIRGADNCTVRNITATNSTGFIRVCYCRGNGDAEDPAQNNLIENIDASNVTSLTGEAVYIGLGKWGNPIWEQTGDASTGNTFRRLLIPGATGEGFDIKYGADNTTVEYCKIEGCSQTAILTNGAENCVIRYNSIDGSSSTNNYGGIWVGKNCDVYGNIVFGYTGGSWKAGISAIGMGDCTTASVGGNEIHNNTVYNCRNGIFIDAGANTIKNNIASECESYELYVPYASGTSSTVGYNDYYDDGGNVVKWHTKSFSAVQINNGEGPGGFTDMAAAPLFFNAALHDFNLRENSPCIDAGVNVGLPYHGSAPDMGALEFGFGSPPSAPTGLIILD